MSVQRNVFISRPTLIEENFETAYTAFHRFLLSENLVPRRLGESDYSYKAPLQAVMEIIAQCSGTIVLGYPQMRFHHEWKRGSEVQNQIGYVFPTPWNQIEGALAFRARAPVLVIAHTGVNGGIFDHGVTGESVIHVDLGVIGWFKLLMFSQPFAQWHEEIKRCADGRLTDSQTATPQ